MAQALAASPLMYVAASRLDALRQVAGTCLYEARLSEDPGGQLAPRQRLVWLYVTATGDVRCISQLPESTPLARWYWAGRLTRPDLFASNAGWEYERVGDCSVLSKAHLCSWMSQSHAIVEESAEPDRAVLRSQVADICRAQVALRTSLTG